MTTFREIDHDLSLRVLSRDAAQALLNQHYAPGSFEAEAFAVVTLPYESDLPDWSEDEWDGMFVMQTFENVTLLYYRKAPEAMQLALF